MNSVKESTVEAFERKWGSIANIIGMYVIGMYVIGMYVISFFEHLQHGKGLGDFNMIDMNC